MSLMRRLSHAAAAATLALGALTALAVPADAAPSTTPARLSPQISSVNSATVAGYAVAGSRITRVSTTFNLPTVSSCQADGSNPDPLIGADMDGYSNNVFEQAGYEYDCLGGGWRPFVMCYPTPCDWPIPPLPGPDPQDVISITLSNVGGDNFTVSFSDLTHGWSGSTSFQDPYAQLTSGEALVEDATSGGNPLPLANFSPVTFRGTTVNSAPLSAGSAVPIVMVTPAGQTMARPSAINGGTFSVQWLSSGP